MARLIERHGGVAQVSPSMREVPLDDHPETLEFLDKLLAGAVDLLVLMTGVGTRQLAAIAQQHDQREAFVEALQKTRTIARGPKPVAALKELGLSPTYRVPEPNTWRELLATLDAQLPLEGLHVAVQEYGAPNPELVSGLMARGARVRRVEVYRWDLPLDRMPLEENVDRLIAGEIDVALFTSSQQVINLLQVAAKSGKDVALRRALDHVVVGSIGPTTSETLRGQGLPVDFEPDHPKMGHLVATAARCSGAFRARKEEVRTRLEALSAPRPDSSDAPWHDSLFLRACRREPTERTPIWLMRQAGRYMQEYREIRAQTTFLELCKNPALCAEVMLMAVDRLGVDAAIIFSDLLPILEPMGLELEFAQGEGPVIHNPVREAEDLQRVVELDSLDALDFVMETVRATRAGLAPQLPLIGFAGAPFTLASYAIEGGASRAFLHTKTLMYRSPDTWNELLGRLSRSIARYLTAQIAAGVQAVQLFDSWVGCLAPDDYRRYVLPHTKAVIDALPDDVPVIHFATGNPSLLPLMAEAGGHVMGIDWRVELDEAWRQVGYDRAVQGNLDPLVLLADEKQIRRQARRILQQAGGRPGHIFNLGHGVLPQTPVASAVALVEAVRELSSVSAAK